MSTHFRRYKQTVIDIFFQTHGSASTYSHGQKSAAGVYSQIKAKIMAGQKSAASSESKVILPGSNSYSNIKMGHH